MHRFLSTIGVFFVLALAVSAQEEMRVVDSLGSVLATQEGREKVLTMIELTWEFYDVSFDDCIRWGEKAIKEANALGYKDLEAKSNYVLGIQYAHHADLDLAKDHLTRSYVLNEALSDTANMFEALWSMATYELLLGRTDSSTMYYNKALLIAERLKDSLLCAQVYSNMAINSYKKGDFATALDYYHYCKKVYKALGMEQMEIQVATNIATIYFEIGKPLEAKRIFESLLPDLEALEDYYILQTIYKNIGSLYAREIINYDSAMLYFEKSMYYADCHVKQRNDEGLMRKLKSDLLSEMAFVSSNRGNNEAALNYYFEALSLAEKESHFSGQMMACIGLGEIYSKTGQHEKSIKYFDRFFELAAMFDDVTIRASVRVPLILDYARLGRYEDLEKELRNIDDERAALVRENADLHERNFSLEETIADLLTRVEQQDAANSALQADFKRCRLTFYGSLAIAIAALLVWAVAKILKHYFSNRAKCSE